jgi:hypothetical protein
MVKANFRQARSCCQLHQNDRSVCYQHPARALVHYMTVKNALSDDEMREGMAKIGMTAEEIEKLMPVAQYQRDFLSEQGNFEHPAVKRARAKAPQRS